MIDFNSPRELLIGVFVLVVIVAAIAVAAKAGRGNMAKAANSFGVVFIAVAMLGLAGLGAALLVFGGRILESAGLSTGG